MKPEDLAGKYKAPFEKLKQQLKKELEEYLIAFILEGLVFQQDETGAFDEFVAAVNQENKKGIGKEIGRAAFKFFDLQQVQEIARRHREKILELYKPYFDRFTCLYCIGECFNENNPQTPKIYNSLVDKFYNEATGEWIKQERTENAVLIYIRPADDKPKEE